MATYSELAEKLSREKGKFDKLASSTDPAEKFTGERMGKSVDGKLEFLFNVQESQKGMGGGLSYRQGGDPGNPFAKKPAAILPEVRKMFEQFQFETADRTLAPPTSPPSDGYVPEFYSPMGSISHRERGFNDAFKSAMTNAKNAPAPPKPLPAGVFRDYFSESFANNRLADKWNTSGYEKGKLPDGSFDAAFNNARFTNKWNTSGYERAKAPTGSFEEVFMRALRNPSSPSGNLPKVTDGSTSGKGGGKGGNSNPTTTTPATNKVEDRVAKLTSLESRKLAPFMATAPKITKGVTGKPFYKPGAEKAAGVTPGQVVEGIAPFLDNFANLINPTPRVPVPTLLRTPQFETKFNIEPQLQEMRRGLRTMGQQVDRSVGQGNVAAAYKAKGLADYFRAAGSAYSQKENTERQLRNAQTEAVANVDQANTQMLNNFKLQQAGRAENERGRRIGLLNNLGEDFMTIRNDRLMKELDMDKFAILGNVFKDVIFSNPQMKKLFQDQQAGGVYKKYGGKIKMRY